MPKIKNEEKIEKREIELSLEVIKLLAQEVKDFGRDAFLLKRKCIKLDEGGHWIIMSYDGLKGQEADFGYQYMSDIPYQFWGEVLDQVMSFIGWQERKYKEQQKLLGNEKKDEQ